MLLYATSEGKRMVKFKASQLWNELPNELKQMQSENSFKLQLKTYLLKKL